MFSLVDLSYIGHFSLSAPVPFAARLLSPSPFSVELNKKLNELS